MLYNVFLSDDDLDKFFNQEPLSSKSLTIVKNIKVYGLYPKKDLRFYLGRGLSRISQILIQLGRFGQNSIDSLKKSFE